MAKMTKEEEFFITLRATLLRVLDESLIRAAIRTTKDKGQNKGQTRKNTGKARKRARKPKKAMKKASKGQDGGKVSKGHLGRDGYMVRRVWSAPWLERAKRAARGERTK